MFLSSSSLNNIHSSSLIFIWSILSFLYCQLVITITEQPSEKINIIVLHICCYSSVLCFFFPCFCPSLAAHLNPRLSEAESGVFPILQDTESEPPVSQEYSTVALFFLFAHFLSLNNSPGRDSSLMIGWTVHGVDPGGAAQHIRWLCCWKGCGCPFPCVSHHIVQPCRKIHHSSYIKNHTVRIFHTEYFLWPHRHLRGWITANKHRLVLIHFCNILFCPLL